MELTFLGTGAAYYPTLGSTSACFRLGKILYLLDCGETTFARLFGSCTLTSCDRVVVLITHLHADHIGSLGSFVSYCKHVLHKQVTLCTPDDTFDEVMALTGLALGRDYDRIGDFSAPLPGGLAAKPIATLHDRSMYCCGYLLGEGAEAVYYGGDANGMPDDMFERLKGGMLARAYQEATYETGVYAGHSSLEQLCALIPAHLRSRVVLMHFGGSFECKAQAAGFAVARPGETI